MPRPDEFARGRKIALPPCRSIGRHAKGIGHACDVRIARKVSRPASKRELIWQRASGSRTYLSGIVEEDPLRKWMSLPWPRSDGLVGQNAIATIGIVAEERSIGRQNRCRHTQREIDVQARDFGRTFFELQVVKVDRKP